MLWEFPLENGDRSVCPYGVLLWVESAGNKMGCEIWSSPAKTDEVLKLSSGILFCWYTISWPLLNFGPRFALLLLDFSAAFHWLSLNYCLHLFAWLLLTFCSTFAQLRLLFLLIIGLCYAWLLLYFPSASTSLLLNSYLTSFGARYQCINVENWY